VAESSWARRRARRVLCQVVRHSPWVTGLKGEVLELHRKGGKESARGRATAGLPSALQHRNECCLSLARETQ
jgi:hypothetical protein